MSFTPFDQKRAFQLASDVLNLTSFPNAADGEAQARRELIDFCQWALEENAEGRLVDLKALTQGTLCPAPRSFCPITGNVQTENTHETIQR